MKAPLPEVPPLAPPQAAKPAPPGLTFLFGWQIASLVLSLLFYPSDPEWSRLDELIWDGVEVALTLPLAFFLWRGANWARLVNLYLTALFSPLYLVPASVLGDFASKAPPLLQGFDAALCVFSLVYLNLPAVKAHFRAPKSLE
ncbi:MAG: hypothetical protein KY445_02410 [Armatimonadetes bacterium]|nr:hypothetical protein [Armatimonadota bacterium]